MKCTKRKLWKDNFVSVSRRRRFARIVSEVVKKSPKGHLRRCGNKNRKCVTPKLFNSICLVYYKFPFLFHLLQALDIGYLGFWQLECRLFLWFVSRLLSLGYKNTG